ncbi:MAG TPA: hypothetical protein VGO61_20870 [Steroidobacteraceae bacterium]|nr:hypothetical protein [Steroidobacteraceae bacterium]
MRVVNSLDDLLQLPRDTRVNGFRARELLQLEIPALTRHALTGAQDRLNSLQKRGGALAGATVMFLAMVLGVIKAFYDNPSILSARAIGEIAAALVISFGLGAVAKLGALAFRRWQFAYRCRAQHCMLSMLLREPAAQ